VELLGISFGGTNSVVLLALPLFVLLFLFNLLMMAYVVTEAGMLVLLPPPGGRLLDEINLTVRSNRLDELDFGEWYRSVPSFLLLLLYSWALPLFLLGASPIFELLTFVHTGTGMLKFILFILVLLLSVGGLALNVMLYCIYSLFRTAELVAGRGGTSSLLGKLRVW
jgi:hypothetical protein